MEMAMGMGMRMAMGMGMEMGMGMAMGMRSARGKVVSKNVGSDDWVGCIFGTQFCVTHCQNYSITSGQ